MNLANFKISISNSVGILKEFELFKNENYRKAKVYDSSKFSEKFIRISNDSRYVDIYNTAIKYGDYDILLVDDSILQYSYDISDNKVVKYRFAFYQNPREYPTYEEFLEDTIGEPYEVCGSMFLEEYEQMICEAKLNDGAVSIRYDYDEKLYDKKYHPVSHIHIGHNNSIRIACDKIFTPDVFTIFVIKNVYYRLWKGLCESQEELMHMTLQIKKKCIDIEELFLSSEELKNLYIS